MTATSAPGSQDWSKPAIRRVVTGETAGKGSVAKDSTVEALDFAGVSLFKIWAFDDLPETVPKDGLADIFAAGKDRDYRNVTINMSIFKPNELVGKSSDNDAPVAFDDHGFHRTDTVDLAMIVSGTVLLRLNDGSETILTAGQWVVQNGTEHAWVNVGSDEAVMVWVIVPATRS